MIIPCMFNHIKPTRNCTGWNSAKETSDSVMSTLCYHRFRLFLCVIEVHWEVQTCFAPFSRTVTHRTLCPERGMQFLRSVPPNGIWAKFHLAKRSRNVGLAAAGPFRHSLWPCRGSSPGAMRKASVFSQHDLCPAFPASFSCRPIVLQDCGHFIEIWNLCCGAVHWPGDHLDEVVFKWFKRTQSSCGHGLFHLDPWNGAWADG